MTDTSVASFTDRFFTNGLKGMCTAVVFDLEFTAWDGSLEHNWLRPGEFREVVQIGAVKLDADSLREIAAFDAFIRPRINPVFERLVRCGRGSQPKFHNARPWFSGAGMKVLVARGAKSLFSDEDAAAKTAA